MKKNIFCIIIFTLLILLTLIAGMAKRPMGFPTPNFVQGQVSANTPGTPAGGATQQLQSNPAMAHTGKV